MNGLLIVGLNLAPLAGVVWFGWGADVLLLLYWAENVVAGLLALGRIVASGAVRGLHGWLETAIVGPFFILHYGAFCAVHLIILALMLSPDAQAGIESGAVFIDTPAPLFSSGALWSLALLALPHLYGFAAWLKSGEARRHGFQQSMGRLYAGMILLHVAVLLGALAVFGLGHPLWAVVLLVALKIAGDLLLERSAAVERARK